MRGALDQALHRPAQTARRSGNCQHHAHRQEAGDDAAERGPTDTAPVTTVRMLTVDRRNNNDARRIPPPSATTISQVIAHHGE
ncbi:hypothetical protein GCM10027436_69090 [Actinophytocola sediminis]